MSGLNTAINTFGSYWSPCDLRHASPRISATTCTYDLCLTGAAPAHGTGIEGLEALEAFQEFLLFSIYIYFYFYFYIYIYIYIFIYIYTDGCWCLLMLIDVREFWMMLIPFFDLWINFYHRSIFSRIVVFSMDKWIKSSAGRTAVVYVCALHGSASGARETQVRPLRLSGC